MCIINDLLVRIENGNNVFEIGSLGPETTHLANFALSDRAGPPLMPTSHLFTVLSGGNPTCL
jgi:hypothetical protein